MADYFSDKHRETSKHIAWRGCGAFVTREQVKQTYFKADVNRVQLLMGRKLMTARDPFFAVIL